MIYFWFLFVWIFTSLKRNEAFEGENKNSSDEWQGRFSQKKMLKLRGIEEFDREWKEYLTELKRLKLHEMKKDIRSKVLNDFVYPYFSLNEILRRLELLKMYDSDNLEIGYVKNSIEGNKTYRTVSGQGILYIKISETDEGGKDRESRKDAEFARPIIVLVAGIGGSDWIAVQIIMHIVTKLVTSYDDEKLMGYDWWIIPVLNPDGYINSMALRNHKTNINKGAGCPGVNLDRNFLLQRDSCECAKKRMNCSEYPGEHPFSEIESSALRDFISPRVDNCAIFIALKEGAKALVYPFASARNSSPGAQTVLQNLLCVEALEVFDELHTGEKEIFKFGTSGNVFGPSGGYVEDWAKKHMGIPRSFAFYVADENDRFLSPLKIEDYGEGTLKVVEVLATSRRVELYAESFDEMITNQRIVYGSFKQRKPRPVPWCREMIDENLLNKIKRGARLEMPIEFSGNVGNTKFNNFEYFGTE